MFYSVNPNSLLKDELTYELGLRWGPCFGGMISLNKHVRAAISDCLPSAPEKYLTMDVQEEFVFYCKIKWTRTVSSLVGFGSPI